MHRIFWIVASVALLATACGDGDGSVTAPPATAAPTATTSAPAATPAPAPDLAGELFAAVVAGDRAAAELIATPNVVDLLEPWAPVPGATLTDDGSGRFFVTLGIGDVIECTEGAGLVQACEAVVPDTESSVEPEGPLYGVDDAANVIIEFLEAPLGEFVIASGAVVRGERVVYLLDTGGGEVLVPALSSLEANAVYDVYAPGGELLAQERTGGPVLLPEPGEIQIVVGGTRGNATYDLGLMRLTAQTVRFAPGTSGATLTGEASQAYVLGAAAGQVMEIAAVGTDVTVYTPGGAPLFGDRFELPEDGDYVMVAEAAGSFSVVVSIN